MPLLCSPNAGIFAHRYTHSAQLMRFCVVPGTRPLAAAGLLPEWLWGRSPSCVWTERSSGMSRGLPRAAAGRQHSHQLGELRAGANNSLSLQHESRPKPSPEAAGEVFTFNFP